MFIGPRGDPEAKNKEASDPGLDSMEPSPCFWFYQEGGVQRAHPCDIKKLQDASVTARYPDNSPDAWRTLRGESSMTLYDSV